MMLVQDLNNVEAAIAAYLQANPPTMPPGTVFWFGGDTPPAGSLLRDGSAVSRTTYAALFAAIGTRYGVGDGSTTFNLPNDTNNGNTNGGDFIRASNDVRAVGTKMTSQNKAHIHDVLTRDGAGAAPGGRPLGHASSGSNPGIANAGAAVSSGGSEAFPDHTAYLPCIAY